MMRTVSDCSCSAAKSTSICASNTTWIFFSSYALKRQTRFWKRCGTNLLTTMRPNTRWLSTETVTWGAKPSTWPPPLATDTWSRCSCLTSRVIHKNKHWAIRLSCTVQLKDTRESCRSLFSQGVITLVFTRVIGWAPQLCTLPRSQCISRMCKLWSSLELM